MKRLGRWLFNFSAGVSLLLLIALLWMRVQARPPAVVMASPSPALPPERAYVLEGITLENGQYVAYFEDSNSGRTVVKRANDPLAQGTLTEIAVDGIVYDAGTPIRIPVGSNLAGQSVLTVGRVISRGASPSTSAAQPRLNHIAMDGSQRLVIRLNGLSLRLPYWLLLLATSILPLLWCISLFRRRTAASGFCPVCGYDLRATPERCPECGTTPAAGISEWSSKNGGG